MKHLTPGQAAVVGMRLPDQAGLLALVVEAQAR